MDIGIEIETKRFNAALARIDAMTKDPAWQKKVIDHEVTKILEVTMQRMKKSTIRSIRRSQATRPPWRTYDLGRGMKKYKLTNRYPNTVWRKIRMNLAMSMRRKTDAREFARQTWFKIANALGLSVNVTDQTRIAHVPGVANRKNIAVAVTNRPGMYGIEMQNHSPLNRFSDARQALFSAIKGRRRFFEQTLKTTYRDQIKPIAERYGLTVN